MSPGMHGVHARERQGVSAIVVHKQCSASPSNMPKTPVVPAFVCMRWGYDPALLVPHYFQCSEKKKKQPARLQLILGLSIARDTASLPVVLTCFSVLLLFC